MNKLNEKTRLSFIGYFQMDNWSIRYLKSHNFNYDEKYNLYKIGDFLTRNKEIIEIEDDKEYKRVTIKLYNKGVYIRDTEFGKNIGIKKQYKVKEGQFILSKIDARNGAFGLVPSELEGAITTADFLSYDIDTSKINPEFLSLLTTTKEFLNYCQNSSSGTTGRQRINEKSFLEITIPIPIINKQNKIVTKYNEKINLAHNQEKEAEELEKSIERFLVEEIGIETLENKTNTEMKLSFIQFKNIIEWGLDKNNYQSGISSKKYEMTSFEKKQEYFKEIFRGKSPKYDEKSNKIILNQKCNRWNEIELEYAKKVNEKWISGLDRRFFTNEGDILINSTGEGTIGRASYINKSFINLLYDSHLLLLRVNSDKINPLFFTYFFNSTLGQEQVGFIKSAQSTKQTELGINNLKKINFPILPLEIQNKIVKIIKEKKEKIKLLKEQAEYNRKTAIEEFEKEIFQDEN